MKKVRNSVFETNSSSTHSICIATRPVLQLKDEVWLEFGEFGWESDEYSDTTSKASYLYTALVEMKRIDLLDNMVQLLLKNGILCKFVDDPDNPNKKWFGIDHVGELHDFVEAVCTNERLLMDYLFSPQSFIVTGNDNDSDDGVSPNVKYDHIEFYKGN